MSCTGPSPTGPAAPPAVAARPAAGGREEVGGSGLARGEKEPKKKKKSLAVGLTSDNRKDSASLWKVSSRTVRASLWKGGGEVAQTHTNRNRVKDQTSCQHQAIITTVPTPRLAPPPHLVTVCLIGRSCSRMEWFMVDGISSSFSYCLHTTKQHTHAHQTHLYISRPVTPLTLIRQL